MTTSPSITLQDASGNLWSVWADTNGLLNTSSIGPGSVPNFLLDDPTLSTSWQLFIDAPAFSQLFTDPFATANPLNPADWVQIPTLGALQAVSGKCRGTSLTADNAENFIGASYGANQFLTVTLTEWVKGHSQSIDLCVRTDNATQLTGYNLEILDNGDGSTGILSLANLNVSPTPVWTLGNLNIAVGDTYTLAAYGGNVYVYRNNLLYFSGPVSASDTGNVGLEITVNTALTDASVGPFKMGTLAVVSTGILSTQQAAKATYPNSALLFGVSLIVNSNGILETVPLPAFNIYADDSLMFVRQAQNYFVSSW